MKKQSFVAALLAGLVTSVTAAQAQSPTVNWTGFYIGGHGGYQWSAIDLGFEHPLPGLGDGVSLDTDGGMGGVHGGVQQQFGNWVLGVELSGDWGDNSGSASKGWEFDGTTAYNPPDIGFCPGRFCFVTPPGLVGPFGFGQDSVETSTDELFLAVGRVGYAWNNTLFFFKGGFASAEVSTGGAMSGQGGVCAYFNCLDLDAFPPTESLVEWSASGSSSKRHNGFALGGGFDMMLWQNVSFGVEYNYINLSSETHTGKYSGSIALLDCIECTFDGKYNVKVNPDDIHYVNARLTLHFNGSSP
jgi:outer membrane immunogenic protein